MQFSLMISNESTLCLSKSCLQQLIHLTVTEKKNYLIKASSLGLLLIKFHFLKMRYIPIMKITRIDVYETLCPKQMLVHKGGKLRTGVGRAEMSHLQNCCLKISG